MKDGGEERKGVCCKGETGRGMATIYVRASLALCTLNLTQLQPEAYGVLRSTLVTRHAGLR